MDRTGEFFQDLAEFNTVGSATRVLKKSEFNLFNTAAYKIVIILDSISHTLTENRESFVDKYGALLSRRSTMSDTERAEFVIEIQNSIKQAENQITQLANSINSGKMGLHGNAIDHSIGVFAFLDLSLNQIRHDFAAMKTEREQVKIQSNAVMMEQLNIEPKAVKKTIAPTYEANDSYIQKLELEHENIVDELLEFNNQIENTQQIAQELTEMQQLFNELMVTQTEQIRVIKKNVEEAAINYETGSNQIDKAGEKTKRQHMWIAILVYLLGLYLILNEIHN